MSAEWVKAEARRARWTTAYKAEVEVSIANHLRKLTALQISDINAPIAAPYLRKVERTAPDMAKKVRQRLRAILDASPTEAEIMRLLAFRLCIFVMSLTFSAAVAPQRTVHLCDCPSQMASEE